MHIRPVTKCRPAPAADIVFILDALAQLLTIIEGFQAVLGKQ